MEAGVPSVARASLHAERLCDLSGRMGPMEYSGAMTGEIDPLGTRKDGLDAFLDERIAEGFAVETRTDTHAIIIRRPKGIGRFRSGDDPGRYVVEVDETSGDDAAGRATPVVSGRGGDSWSTRPLPVLLCTTREHRNSRCNRRPAANR